MTDADYVDDLALLASIPAEAKSQLHSLKQVAGGIGLYVNSDKSEFMRFKQNGDISTLNDELLKLLDHFIYFSSNVSYFSWWDKPTKSMGRLESIWKFDLSDKIKQDFFQAVSVSVLLYGCTNWTLIKWPKKKSDGNSTSPRNSTSGNSNCMAIYLPSHKISNLDELDILDTAEEAKTNS